VQVEGRNRITRKDIEWVAEFGHYSPRIDKKICSNEKRIGCISGLAVYGNSTGMVIDIEVSVFRAMEGKGNIKVTGIVDEEEMDNRGHKLKRSSSARASVENVLTVLKRFLDVDVKEYDIHLNFPGGIPIDGPSAGTAIAVAVYSAIMDLPVNCDIAMTGELSIRGKVKPVGGVAAKIEAAKLAGINRVLIPAENWQETFNDTGIEVIAVDDIVKILELTFGAKLGKSEELALQKPAVTVLSAASVEKVF
jgi:Lon-like ATP-dependent protease